MLASCRGLLTRCTPTVCCLSSSSNLCFYSIHSVPMLRLKPCNFYKSNGVVTTTMMMVVLVQLCCTIILLSPEPWGHSLLTSITPPSNTASSSSTSLLLSPSPHMISATCPSIHAFFLILSALPLSLSISLALSLGLLPLIIGHPQHDKSTFSLFSEEEDRIRVEGLLQYIEDADLRNWSLACAKAFHIGIRDERSKLNCLTNPSMFHLLIKLDPDILIAKGNSLTCSRQKAAKKLLGKTFRIRLGRGLYGECLGIRSDGNSNLSHEIGIELSKLSTEAGLRAIGAVVFMKHGILKVCLRSTDDGVNTAEIAKAYGGGGKPGASSFVMTMDEYNHWIRSS